MTGRALLAVGVACSLAAAFPRASAGAASASGKLSIDATLDPERLAPGETATLTVQVRSEGLNLPDVALPQLPGVTVERAGTAQNFTILNGRVERTSTTVFRLIPRVEGVVRIPPLRVAVGRDRAESSPLTLTVSRGAAGSRGFSSPPRGNRVPGARGPGGVTPPAGTPEVFVRATVDRSRVFWNQQIILRLRLYSRVDIIGDVDWKPPATSGFWTEGLGPPRQARATVNGVEYAMMEIPTALFPTRTGSLTIGPARIRVRVARVIQPPDPWSMLAVPDVIPEDVALTSDPITIAVDPLPRGAPRGFQGAVGDYHLAVRVDGLTARAGEPITARARIGGTGNISTVRDPEIRARGAARQYVAGSSVRIDRNGDRLAGERETDVAFVADQPGTLEILPVTFVWFDPESKRYRSQSSALVKVKVVPGTAAESRPGQTQPGATALAAPRGTPGPFGRVTLDPPPASTAILGFSVLAYGAAMVSRQAKRRRMADPRSMRLARIEEILERDLARAAGPAAQNQPARAAALAEHALLAGAGLRYGVDLAGLARAERIQELRARGAGEAEISALESLLDSLGAIAYAPPETRSSDAKQAIRAVRETLERYRAEMSP